MFSGKEFLQLCAPLKLFFPPLLHFPENEDESTVLYLNLMVTYLGLDPKVPGFRELLKAFPGNQSFAVPSFPFLRNDGFLSPSFGNLGTDTRKKTQPNNDPKAFQKNPKCKPQNTAGNSGRFQSQIGGKSHKTTCSLIMEQSCGGAWI